MAYLVPVDRAGAVPLRPAPAECILMIDDMTIPVAVRDVTGAGARIETSARPAIGTIVSLRHSDGGTIMAETAGHRRTGLDLAFAGDEQAVGFALAVLLGGG